MTLKPTVHILCGFIGDGKTTLAKQLETVTGAVRITEDEWLIQIVGNAPTFARYDIYDGRVCGLSSDVAFQLSEKGIDVINEDEGWGRAKRDILRKRAECTGAQVVMCWRDTSIETIRERVRQRTLTIASDAFTITDDLLVDFLQYWEPPSREEVDVVVNASLSTIEALQLATQSS